MLGKAVELLQKHYPKEHQHMMRIWKASWRTSKRVSIMALAVLTIPGLVMGYLVGKQTTTTNVYVPSTSQAVASQEKPMPSVANATTSEQSPAKVAGGGVLVAGRYYSPSNKNEISARLDDISQAINRADKEMLVPAQNSLLHRFFARPADAGLYVEMLDGIRGAAKRMDTVLYDDLIARERDYRVEMNAILFPKDPLIYFMSAADEYRNGIAVWIKLQSASSDDEANRELQRLVLSAAKSFSTAREELVKWLSRRQDLIAQTRMELRS